MESKAIVNYCDTETYCILVPKYYEYENKPSWCRLFTGTLKECEEHFSLYPEYLKATNDENRESRRMKRKEYLFLQSIGKLAEAEKIRKEFHL